MAWWNRLWNGGATQSSLQQLRLVRFTMQGWTEETTRRDLRVWRDPHGDVLSACVLPRPSFCLPDFSDETALQYWSRDIAEGRGGGLIEVRVVRGTPPPGMYHIYKRLQKPAYVFTGQLFVPR